MVRAPAQLGDASWQGYSAAVWQVNGRPLIDTGGTGFVPINRVQGATRGGQLKVTTTNMKPGYLRKNGVPYSDKAVLTEYFTVLPGQQNDSYIALTAMLDDPTYLTGQFIRTYTFKKVRRSDRLGSHALLDEVNDRGPGDSVIS